MRTFEGCEPGLIPASVGLACCPLHVPALAVSGGQFFMPRVSIHTAATVPCVARGNGVGKFSAAAWMDTPEVPRNSGLLPALGRHTARDATEPPVGDSLGGSRYQARPALIFAALALTGCATHPLTRSCLTQAQYEQMKAAEPAKVHGKLTGKADADIRPITGSAIELRAWGEAELGLLSICAAPVNSTEGK